MLTIKTIIHKKLWLSSLMALIIVLVIIPIVLCFFTPPFVEPKGIDVKNGNRIFYNFLEKVKQDNAVIVLGTSETTDDFEDQNYWCLLDRDTDLNRDFYPFAGAGRCSYTYFPLILDNPEAFKNLNLIYYVNPTYWRDDLNSFNTIYYDRYVNQSLALSVKSKATKHKIYKTFFEPGIAVNTAIPFYLDRWVENYKSLYSYDFRMRTSGSSTNKKVKDISIQKNNIEKVFNNVKNEINLKFNATNSYLKNQFPFPQINQESNFQDEMLIAFINLIKEYQINCTFYLGPYNGVYCKAMNPELISQHDQVIEKIKETLNKEHVPYIDGSYQSTITGTFIDIQHISKYGAYLTAIDIKNYYEKNK